MHGRLNFAWGAAAQKKVPGFVGFCAKEHLGCVSPPGDAEALGCLSRNRWVFTWLIALHRIHQNCEGLRVSSKSLKFLTQNKKGLLIAGVLKSI